MTVTFLWEDGNYDQYSAPVTHPNGDIYFVTKRPSSITVSMIKSGTGEQNDNVHTWKKGADYINAGFVALALHPAGHIIAGGTFITVTGDWSPGYLIALNKIPLYTPNTNYTVVTSAHDSEARRLAQTAIDVSNNALNVLNKTKAEVSANGAAVEQKAAVTINQFVVDANKRINANLSGLDLNKLVEDTIWSKLPDGIFAQLQDPNSPLVQTMIQKSIIGDNALRAELKKTQDQLEHVSKYYYDEIEKIKAQLLGLQS